MPTVKQAYEWYRKALREGKGDMHTGHPYIAEEEAFKRQDNAPDAEGKQKTRIAWDAADPDSYAEWHTERLRWMKVAQQNPTVSTDAMILALKRYSEEEIANLIEILGAERLRLEAMRAAATGIPRAQLGG